MSLHRYLYAANNPVNFIDFLGFAWWNDAWDWAKEHKNEIAMGAAVVGAVGATLLTGGLAAPIIAGAAFAGGTTLAINAGEKYVDKNPDVKLTDDLLGNTIAGGFIGWGIGSVGTAVRGAGAVAKWGASVGGAVTQATGSSTLGTVAGHLFTAGKVASQIIPGVSSVITNGGIDAPLSLLGQDKEKWHNGARIAGWASMVSNLAFSGIGNAAIKWAWNNPSPYTPSSGAFENHHLHPKELGGNPNGNAVTLPNGKNGLSNLHTKDGGIHVAMHQYLKDHFGVSKWGEAKSLFNSSSPEVQTSLINAFNDTYARSLLTPIDWQGISQWMSSEVFNSNGQRDSNEQN